MSTISSTVENPLKQLARFGQSIWLDYIRRSLMTSGELRRMVQEDGLGGMTSNPSIFEKAIEGGEEYADYLAQLKADRLNIHGPDTKVAAAPIPLLPR